MATEQRDDLVEKLLELADWMERHPQRVPLGGVEREEFDPYPMTHKELWQVVLLLEKGE